MKDCNYIGYFSVDNICINHVYRNDNENKWNVNINFGEYLTIEDCLHSYAEFLYASVDEAVDDYKIYSVKCGDKRIWVCENSIRDTSGTQYSMIRGYGNLPETALNDCYKNYCYIIDHYLFTEDEDD